MHHYPLFLLMASLAILTPGPGVLNSLGNALRFGLKGSLPGILGVASGSFIVAALSATGLGLLLAASALAFTVLKWLGAAYLFYLGIKLLRAPAFRFDAPEASRQPAWRQFAAGMLLQMSNPKSIFFFLAIFPQFIDAGSAHYTREFLLLVSSYSLLLVLIHSVYALLAHAMRRWLNNERGGHLVNKASGASFLLFGTLLAASNR
ncbi:LysE family translocator [Chromobacterium sp. IIBBL 290-4]|uniref:LysE family translocator n=1 Tax=Chromobacterium sp. IIBBL 290-4 TaxID=2953890 RepID=UPI0020B6F13E|nr:LysE family translocator [Chromobacterium sp. IIBBL 290-4]UTH76550.1 LysE family translocator [Chromobacterium sp. IIBBL 290-4]